MKTDLAKSESAFLAQTEDINAQQPVTSKHFYPFENHHFVHIVKKRSTWGQTKYTIRFEKDVAIQNKLRTQKTPKSLNNLTPTHLKERFSIMDYTQADVPIIEAPANDVSSVRSMKAHLSSEEMAYIIENAIVQN